MTQSEKREQKLNKVLAIVNEALSNPKKRREIERIMAKVRN